MVLERILFLVAAIAALGYVLFKKRTVDWFSVGVAAATVYFLPGFFGFVINPDLKSYIDIEGITYLVFIAVYVSIVLGAVWQDNVLAKFTNQQAARGRPLKFERYSAPSLIAISVISLVFAVIEMGDLVFVVEKEAAMASHGRWMIAYEFAACLGYLMYVVSGNRRASIFAFLLIIPSIFFGYRTAFVMTLISMLMIRLRGTGPTVLITKWPLILLSIAAIYAMLFFKQILFALKYGLVTGQWSLLGYLVQEENTYIDAVFVSEPFIVQNTLNEVVRTGFSVGIEQLESVLGVFVPFGNVLGLTNKGFNDYFQPALFSDVDYGLASNIWAQAYSIGSLGMVVVFCIIFVVLLAAINIAFARTNGNLHAALALTGAYWSFYIYRNDILYELILIRRVFVFFAVGWLISYLLSKSRVTRR